MLKQKLKDDHNVADGRAPNTPARKGEVEVEVLVEMDRGNLVQPRLWNLGS